MLWTLAIKADYLHAYAKYCTCVLFIVDWLPVLCLQICRTSWSLISDYANFRLFHKAPYRYFVHPYTFTLHINHSSYTYLIMSEPLFLRCQAYLKTLLLVPQQSQHCSILWFTIPFWAPTKIVFVQLPWNIQLCTSLIGSVLLRYLCVSISTFWNTICVYIIDWLDEVNAYTVKIGRPVG